MKKSHLLTFVLLIIATVMFAQHVPQGMNYQAVARDEHGQVLTNQDISLRISLLAEGPDGKMVYSEIHEVTTSTLGLFNVVIGEGSARIGEFEKIPWSSTTMWMDIALGLDGDFISIATTRLLTVPYAFHAGTAGEVIGASSSEKSGAPFWKVNGNSGVLDQYQFLGTTDAKALVFKTNSLERMRLLANGHLQMSNNNIKNLADPVDAQDAVTKKFLEGVVEAISFNWSDISGIPSDIADGDQVNDADSDPTNELQDWSTLPGIPSDIADGDQVNDADSDPTNELQSWSTLPGIPADIADGDQVNDADYDPGNEYNTNFILAGSELQITDNGGTLTTDLSSLAGGGTIQGTDGNNFNIRAKNEGAVPGNARGEHSVDLQSSRSIGIQVASGEKSTISGGAKNGALGDYATVGGGENNYASGYYTTIGGGVDNDAYEDYTTIGGGAFNGADGAYATIGGGAGNGAWAYATIGGGADNGADGAYATIGGGGANVANGAYTTIGGGSGNEANDDYTTISGGFINTADGLYATIGGGEDQYTYGDYSTIGGGSGNGADEAYTTIGGGYGNRARGLYATIGGGVDQYVDGDYSTIGGGAFNGADGAYATIGGGLSLRANSFGETVVGLMNVPSAGNPVEWVETDPIFVVGNGEPNTNTFSNALVVLKNGNTGVGRTPVTNTLEVEGEASKTSPGDWIANSDARLKKNLQPLPSDKMLEKLLALQGINYEWNDTQTGSRRPEGVQYGFTAQNIQAVFPELVEEDNLGFLQTAYGTYDAMFVEAIRELNNKIEQQLEQLNQLKEENARLKEQLEQQPFTKREIEILKAMVNQ